MIERFSSFSAANAELLAGARLREPDTLFDDEVRLDLGGVHVRVKGVGPNHTRGDTVMFVEEDRVLFTGDVVMAVFPSASAQAGSVDKWIDEHDGVRGAGADRRRAGARPPHRRGNDPPLSRVSDGRARRDARGEAARPLLEQVQQALAPTLAQRFPELAPLTGQPTGRINAHPDGLSRRAVRAKGMVFYRDTRLLHCSCFARSNHNRLTRSGAETQYLVAQAVRTRVR